MRARMTASASAKEREVPVEELGRHRHERRGPEGQLPLHLVVGKALQPGPFTAQLRCTCLENVVQEGSDNGRGRDPGLIRRHCAVHQPDELDLGPLILDASCNAHGACVGRVQGRRGPPRAVVRGRLAEAVLLQEREVAFDPLSPFVGGRTTHCRRTVLPTGNGFREFPTPEASGTDAVASLNCA